MPNKRMKSPEQLIEIIGQRGELTNPDACYFLDAVIDWLDRSNDKRLKKTEHGLIIQDIANACADYAAFMGLRASSKAFPVSTMIRYPV